jgi:hypothetical protein
MMSFVLATLITATAPATVNAPPQRTGQCRWVHGRFVVANGSSVRRIWVIGTRRIIALHDSDEDIPPSIARYERGAADYRGLDDALFGDFFVCAQENSRPGWMQHVRLVRTRRLIFRGRAFPNG